MMRRGQSTEHELDRIISAMTPLGRLFSRVDNRH